ncbi:MAG: hypothetical protein Q8L49_02005, partial [Burkholderiaceae bacterium]|nr:hypothetical protein [Burkholderiaceae bacterium]
MPGSVGLYAFVGQCWAGDGAAQPLQRLAIVGAAAHGSVQAEAVAVGAQRLLEVLLAGHDALQRQHLLAGPRTEGDALRAGRRLQRPEHAGLIGVAVAIG